MMGEDLAIAGGQIVVLLVAVIPGMKWLLEKVLDFQKERYAELLTHHKELAEKEAERRELEVSRIEKAVEENGDRIVAAINGGIRVSPG